jgi:UDP-N-acetylglucosamine:LPS N-acetylglucosamine transferase
VTGAGRRLLLVSSSGGVLLDVMALHPWWEHQQVHWVAVDAPDTRDVLAANDVTWAEELSASHPMKAVRNVPAALALLRRKRISLVVSAGSGVAVPYFLAARLAGIPAWWVETLNVVGRPGLAARLCAGVAQCVVVQHSHLLAHHRRAVYVGELY